jgi:hypothetical protein
MTTDAARPISRETAEHYVWGGTCDGWHLVRSLELSIIQERMPRARARRAIAIGEPASSSTYSTAG